MNLVEPSKSSTVDKHRMKSEASLENTDASSSNSNQIKNGGKNENHHYSNAIKSVRFSTVDVRDYTICLGDNPSVSRGVPISLGWDYDEEQIYDINNYECHRSEARRHVEELKIPSLQRVQMLKGLGYSRGEINEQTKKTHRVRERRFQTLRRIDRGDRIKALFRCEFVVKVFRHMMHVPIPQKSKVWTAVDLPELEIEEDSSSFSVSSTVSSTPFTSTTDDRDSCSCSSVTQIVFE